MKEEVVWSPDGKYVALPCGEFSEAGASEQIVVVNMESGETKRLTSLAGVNAWPTWSPDGKKIMYWHAPLKYWWSAPIPLNTDIWVMDADGGNKKQLTDGTESNEDGFWSPDGSKIAYDSARQKKGGYIWIECEIWMMNADGSGKKLLVKKFDGSISSLEWSPDGSKIAFDIEVEGKLGNSDIYMINVPSGE
jgi:TolB protein